MGALISTPTVADNDWVYEKVCLDELQITTELDSKLSYTPCYTQCGLIRIKFDTKHYKKLFKNVRWKI